MLPAPVIVRVVPLMVPGPLTTWNVTGNPDVIVASEDKSNGASPKVFPAKDPNVMVWEAWAT